MLFLQHLIGFIVCAGVICYAAWMTHEEGRDASGKYEVVPSFLIFAGTFFGVYMALAVVVGILWCVVSVVAFLCQAVLWLIEGALYVPLHLL